MSEMPWWKFRTGTSLHVKLQRLRAILEDNKADAYWYRLLDHCAFKQPDGRYEGPGAARFIEQAVQYDGPPGRLTEALQVVRLLEQTNSVDGSIEVHDWRKEQAAIFKKFVKDRQRFSRKRDEEEQLHQPSREPTQVVSRGGPRDSPLSSISFISSSSFSRVGGAGEGTAAPKLEPPKLATAPPREMVFFARLQDERLRAFPHAIPQEPPADFEAWYRDTLAVPGVSEEKLLASFAEWLREEYVAKLQPPGAFRTFRKREQWERHLAAAAVQLVEAERCAVPWCADSGANRIGEVRFCFTHMCLGFDVGHLEYNSPKEDILRWARTRTLRAVETGASP
jgi:hypothetical protein